LGLADSAGDALTYYIQTKTNVVITRSVVRSALDTNNINLRGLFDNQIGEENVANPALEPENVRKNIVPYPEEQDLFSNHNIHHSWGDEEESFPTTLKLNTKNGKPH